jgi:hypothetical protein
VCDILKPQVCSCKRFQGQNRHFKALEDYWLLEGFLKLVSSFSEESKKFTTQYHKSKLFKNYETQQHT